MREFYRLIFVLLCFIFPLHDVAPQTALEQRVEVVLPERTIGDSLAEKSKEYLGLPYRWGGKGLKSFDCSGLVWRVYKECGLEIGSCTKAQIGQGVRVSLDEAAPGDLIFFSGKRADGRVGHVGMVVETYDDGSVDFIHASRTRGVVIQRFPDGGYFERRYIVCTRNS